ncbi:mandelate racemase/muconate lactonizing enzyme family protein [Novosphingobium sp.]|uniref:mandelate racemase/muconate lactonizing enzyme family protein n=1 Tax=Novosphingobium sp. TaxID=1874826 RepID=UPI003BA9C374
MSKSWTHTAPIAEIRSHVAGHWLFVTVTTECGTTGIGEATYFPHPLATAAVIEDLGSIYIGADAFRPEWLFQLAIKHHCIRDACQIAAVSALDQALWDIKGKALGVPVWQLLGGLVRDKVRAILLVEAASVDALIAGAVAARDEGFTAIKLKPFVGDWARQTTARMLQDVITTVQETRAAVGWDIDIAVELHRNLPPDLAGVFADGVRSMRPYFLEDPVMPFSLAANVQAARSMGGTVALAERVTNIWEFRDYSDCPDIAILRPDIGLAGGFTQMRKIAAIAESRQQRIVPHNFTSPVATAAHIQMAAATVNWDVQGYVREDRDPWRQVVKAVNRIEDGYLVIPEVPGIGMELDLEWLEGASYQPFGSQFHHGLARAADGGPRQI